ncbi:MAG: hypothetical protein AAGJ56_01510 [Myxococcota bacterium]
MSNSRIDSVIIPPPRPPRRPSADGVTPEATSVPRPQPRPDTLSRAIAPTVGGHSDQNNEAGLDAPDFSVPRPRPRPGEFERSIQSLRQQLDATSNVDPATGRAINQALEDLVEAARGMTVEQIERRLSAVRGLFTAVHAHDTTRAALSRAVLEFRDGEVRRIARHHGLVLSPPVPGASLSPFDVALPNGATEAQLRVADALVATLHATHTRALVEDEVADHHLAAIALMDRMQQTQRDRMRRRIFQQYRDPVELQHFQLEPDTELGRSLYHAASALLEVEAQVAIPALRDLEQAAGHRPELSGEIATHGVLDFDVDLPWPLRTSLTDNAEAYLPAGTRLRQSAEGRIAEGENLLLRRGEELISGARGRLELLSSGGLSFDGVADVFSGTSSVGGDLELPVVLRTEELAFDRSTNRLSTQELRFGPIAVDGETFAPLAETGSEDGIWIGDIATDVGGNSRELEVTDVRVRAGETELELDRARLRETRGSDGERVFELVTDSVAGSFGGGELSLSDTTRILVAVGSSGIREIRVANEGRVQWDGERTEVSLEGGSIAFNREPGGNAGLRFESSGAVRLVRDGSEVFDGSNGALEFAQRSDGSWRIGAELEEGAGTLGGHLVRGEALSFGLESNPDGLPSRLELSGSSLQYDESLRIDEGTFTIEGTGDRVSAQASTEGFSLRDGSSWLTIAGSELDVDFVNGLPRQAVVRADSVRGEHVAGGAQRGLDVLEGEIGLSFHDNGALRSIHGGSGAFAYRGPDIQASSLGSGAIVELDRDGSFQRGSAGTTALSLQWPDGALVLRNGGIEASRNLDGTTSATLTAAEVVLRQGDTSLDLAGVTGDFDLFADGSVDRLRLAIDEGELATPQSAITLAHGSSLEVDFSEPRVLASIIGEAGHASFGDSQRVVSADGMRFGLHFEENNQWREFALETTRTQGQFEGLGANGDPIGFELSDTDLRVRNLGDGALRFDYAASDSELDVNGHALGITGSHGTWLETDNEGRIVSGGARFPGTIDFAHANGRLSAQVSGTAIEGSENLLRMSFEGATVVTPEGAAEFNGVEFRWADQLIEVNIEAGSYQGALNGRLAELLRTQEGAPAGLELERLSIGLRAGEGGGQIREGDLFVETLTAQAEDLRFEVRNEAGRRFHLRGELGEEGALRDIFLQVPQGGEVRVFAGDHRLTLEEQLTRIHADPETRAITVDSQGGNFDYREGSFQLRGIGSPNSRAHFELNDEHGIAFHSVENYQLSGRNVSGFDFDVNFGSLQNYGRPSYGTIDEPDFKAAFGAIHPTGDGHFTGTVGFTYEDFPVPVTLGFQDAQGDISVSGMVATNQATAAMEATGGGRLSMEAFGFRIEGDREVSVTGYLDPHDVSRSAAGARDRVMARPQFALDGRFGWQSGEESRLFLASPQDMRSAPFGVALELQIPRGEVYADGMGFTPFSGDFQPGFNELTYRESMLPNLGPDGGAIQLGVRGFRNFRNGNSVYAAFRLSDSARVGYDINADEASFHGVPVPHQFAVGVVPQVAVGPSFNNIFDGNGDLSLEIFHEENVLGQIDGASPLLNGGADRASGIGVGLQLGPERGDGRPIELYGGGATDFQGGFGAFLGGRIRF